MATTIWASLARLSGSIYSLFGAGLVLDEFFTSSAHSSSETSLASKNRHDQYHHRKLQVSGRQARYRGNRFRQLPRPATVAGNPAVLAVHARYRVPHGLLSARPPHNACTPGS